MNKKLSMYKKTECVVIRKDGKVYIFPKMGKYKFSQRKVGEAE